MAYDPSLDFDTQEQQLVQTAARIKALRAMQAPELPEQGGGFTSAVTGTKFIGAQPKANILGQLTPLIAQTRAGYDEGQMNKTRSELTSAEVADAVKQMQNYPSGPDTTPAQTGAAMAGLYGNPLTKPIAGPALEDALTKAPDRVLARTIAAEEKKRAQWNLDRTFQETHNYHQAQLGKQGSGGFQDSGLADDKGAKLYSHPDGRAYSLNYPLQATGEATIPPQALPPQMRQGPASTANSPTPVPFVQPNGRSQNTAPGLMSGIQSPPAAPSGEQIKSTEAAGVALSALQDLRARRRALPPSMLGDVLPTTAGKSKIAAWLDPDAPKRAGFHADMQDFVNTKLYESSGKAINEQEMVRIKATMPNAASTDEEWERWGQRVEDTLKVSIARRQALDSHPKDYVLDPQVNAVVNKRTGQIIPGTESPFKKEIDTENAVAAHVKAKGEPTIGAGTDMASMQADIDAMPESLEKALAQRAFDKQKKGKLPRATAKAAAPSTPGAAPSDGLSTTEDGYRYTPGPGGRGNKANWSKQ